MKKIPIIEMFGPTIQGEGAHCGEQTFFIRVGLCDFKCKKCDSMHAVNPDIVKQIAKYMDAEELLDTFLQFTQTQKALHLKTVTLTGGNPAIHKDLEYFVLKLYERGYKIVVETQGTKIQEWMTYCHISISPKTPGMGEKFNDAIFKKFMTELTQHIQPLSWSVKLVVFDALDLEIAISIFKSLEHWQYDTKNKLFLSLGNPFPPEYEIIENTVIEKQPKNIPDDLNKYLMQRYTTIAQQVMQDHRLANVKFLPQLHVLAYGNNQGY